MALICCPDCVAHVSSDATKCEGCGCVLRIRVRTIWGKFCKWTFVLWNILMLVWVVGGTISASNTPTHSNAERAGVAIGTAIGVGILVWIWLSGTFLLGILVLLSRPNSASPSIPAPRATYAPRAPSPVREPVREEPAPVRPAPVITPAVAPSSRRKLAFAVPLLAGTLIGASAVFIVLWKHSDSSQPVTTSQVTLNTGQAIETPSSPPIHVEPPKRVHGTRPLAHPQKQASVPVDTGNSVSTKAPVAAELTNLDLGSASQPTVNHAEAVPILVAATDVTKLDGGLPVIAGDHDGVVWAKLCIDESGGVKSAKVVQSSEDTAVQELALSAVKEWRYHPYLDRDSRARPVCFKLPLHMIVQRN